MLKGKLDFASFIVLLTENKRIRKSLSLFGNFNDKRENDFMFRLMKGIMNKEKCIDVFRDFVETNEHGLNKVHQLMNKFLPYKLEKLRLESLISRLDFICKLNILKGY